MQITQIRLITHKLLTRVIIKDKEEAGLTNHSTLLGSPSPRKEKTSETDNPVSLSKYHDPHIFRHHSQNLL